MESKRVVVTGLGAITPIGKTLPEYWEGLVRVETVLARLPVSILLCTRRISPAR